MSEAVAHQPEEISEADLALAGWSRGTLLHLFAADGGRWAHQLRLYGFLTRPDRLLVANVHRQYGKSFCALLVAVEMCLRRPGVRAIYLAPYASQLRSYLLPQMSLILRGCPERLKPGTGGLDNNFTFPNGSSIKFDGADGEHREAIRGRAADLVIVDEARDISELRYLIDDIVVPMFTTTRGKLIVISTPPRSPGHYFVDLANRAEAKECYLRLTVRDNPSVGPEELAEWAEAAGGEDSVSFRRERLCEFITDEETAVVPEFTEAAERAIVRAVRPPDQFERRVIAMDPGRKDFTGILWGYWNFREARLHVQAEHVLKRMLIDDLVRVLRDRTAEVWPGLPSDAESVRRVSDQNDVLFELGPRHGVHFQPVSKVTKEEMVAKVRDWIHRGRIRIDPSCKELVFQIRSAIWSKAKDRFVRPETGGHFDLLDALIYMCRAAPEHVNPYPSAYADFDPTRQTMDLDLLERDRRERSGFEALVKDPWLDY